MKIALHEAVLSRGDALRVDPRKLMITPGYNVRDFTTPAAQAALNVLKEAIREQGGVHTPLRVRMSGTEMHIVEGHRRHKAVMELIAEGMEIQSIPAVAEERHTDDAERTLGLIISNSGEPLTEPEKAEVVRRLKAMGWTNDKICNRLGYKTEQTIANFELWLGAPSAVKAAVASGVMAYSTAVEIARAADGDEAKAAATLKAAKASAKKRGAKKVTSQDLPKGQATAAEVELRNIQRLAKLATVEDIPTNALTAPLALIVERAIKALITVAQSDHRAAEYIGLELDVNAVSDAAEWLMDFEHRYRKAKEAVAPVSVGNVTAIAV